MKQICNAIKFPRSTYYKHINAKPSKRDIEILSFQEEIKKIYFDSKQRYGAPKIQKVLESKGIIASLKRVQRHMAKLGLRSIVVKKYKHHNSKTKVEERENILGGNFEATTINQKWCTDITYIHVLKEGWTYLASVIDLYPKKIVGYAYGTKMTTELAIEAVQNATLNVKDVRGIIVHSDLGSQYTSHVFQSFLSGKGMIQSFSRKGNPYDNACIESFHSILKKEEIYGNTYQDFNQAKRAIFEYIESWYNRKRIHSAIGYLTPEQRENIEIMAV